MKFYTYVEVTGDLILIKTNIPTPPPCPVIARSAKPAAPKRTPSTRLVCLVLWFIAFFAPVVAHWPPKISPANHGRLAVFGIIALATIEVLVQARVERALGMMT